MVSDTFERSFDAMSYDAIEKEFERWKIFPLSERKYKHLHQQMNIPSLRWYKRENDENVWKSNQKALVIPLQRAWF